MHEKENKIGNQICCTAGGGWGKPPPPPHDQTTTRPSREKRNLLEGKSGQFWYANFWVPVLPPSPRFHISLGQRHARLGYCQMPIPVHRTATGNLKGSTAPFGWVAPLATPPFMHHACTDICLPIGNEGSLDRCTTAQRVCAE